MFDEGIAPLRVRRDWRVRVSVLAVMVVGLAGTVAMARPSESVDTTSPVAVGPPASPAPQPSRPGESAEEHDALDDATRTSIYRAAQELSAERQRNWIASDEAREVIDALNRDIDAVRHVESQRDYVGPPATFTETVQSADLAVVGTVIELRFEETTTILVFRAESTLRGTTSHKTIEVRIHGGLVRTPEGPVLVDDLAVPVLPVGARAVLLFRRADDGSYRQIPWTGTYIVRADSIDAGSFNRVVAPDALTSLSTLTAVIRAVP